MQVLVRLGDGVPAVAEAGRVAGDPTGPLDDHRRAGGDRVAAARRCGRGRGRARRARRRPRRRPGGRGPRRRALGMLTRGRRALEHRERLAHGEAELRVQRERAVVVGGLDEPDARRPRSRVRARARPPSARGRRRRPGRRDRRSRARCRRSARARRRRGCRRPAVALGDQAGDALRRRASADAEARELGRAGLDREVVALRDRREGVVEDAPAGVGVVARPPRGRSGRVGTVRLLLGHGPDG